MRKLRFRAWHKVHKKMLNVLTISFEHNLIMHDEINDNIVCRKTASNFDEIELMHFTGLYDKNNIPIFEGDLLAAEECFLGFSTPNHCEYTNVREVEEKEEIIPVIAFDSSITDFIKTGIIPKRYYGCPIVEVKAGTQEWCEDGFYTGILLNGTSDQYTVIGNVYQNKELLK